MGSRISEILANLLPFGSMTPHVQEILNTYLLPIAIAIPLAILLYFLGTRKGDEPTAPARREEPTATRRESAPAPAAPAAPASPAIPVAAFAPPPATAAPRPAPPVLQDVVAGTHRPTILIVEDSAVPRVKLVKLFQNAGYLVDAATDGVEALDKIGSGFYSVLITDLEMPNMNGLELISAVQGSMDTEDLPIIAITGHDELQSHVHNYQGLYGIFKKPWNDRELLKRVETLAHLRQPRPVAGA